MLNNDIYEYITFFTDEKTTLAMLSVNKKFYDEKIFLRVMNKKYPLLYKIKNKNKKYISLSLRNFYIKMLNYISKLIQKEIPYISHEDYDPYNLYIMSIKSYTSSLKFIINYASEKVRIDIVKKMLDMGVEVDNCTFFHAIKSKNINIISFLLDNYHDEIKYINKNIVKFSVLQGDIIFLKKILNLNIYEYNEMKEIYNIAMYTAAENGNIQIVRMMLEKGANNFYETMKLARGKESIEIIKIMLEKIKEQTCEEKRKQENIFNQTLSYACQKGDYEIVKILIENVITCFPECLYFSISKNHVDIFNLIIDKCNIDDKYCYFSKKYPHEKYVNKYIYLAAKMGNIDMVIKLSQKENNYGDVLKYAAIGGKIEIYKFLNSQIKDNPEIVKYGAKSGNVDMFNLLFNKFETDISDLDNILFYAIKGGNKNIINFLIQKGAKNKIL